MDVPVTVMIGVERDLHPARVDRDVVQREGMCVICPQIGAHFGMDSFTTKVVRDLAVLDRFDQKTKTSLLGSKKSVGFHGSTVLHHTYGCVYHTFPTR